MYKICLVWTGMCIAYASFAQLDTVSVAAKKQQAASVNALLGAEEFLLFGDVENAIQSYLKAIDIDPKNDAALIKLALLYYSDVQNSMKSVGYVQQAIQVSPQNSYYYQVLSNIYKEQGMYAQAIETMQAMIKNVPHGEQYWKDMIPLYVSNKSYKKALQVYQNLEKKQGESVWTVFNKYELYKKMKQIKKGLKLLEKFIEKHPENHAALVQYVHILSQSGKEKEALAKLEKWQAANPDNKHTYLIWIELKILQKKWEGMEETLSRVVNDTQYSIQDKIEVLSLYVSHRPESLADKQNWQHFMEVLNRLHPNEYATHAFCGQILSEWEEYPQVAKALRKATKLLGTNEQLWNALLSIEFNLEEYDTIVETAQAALEFFPTHAQFYYYLAYGYMRQADYPRSIENIEKGKAFESSELEAQNTFDLLLGTVYEKSKEYNKLLDLYAELAHKKPENYLILNNYSYFLAIHNGDLDLADQLSKKVVQNTDQEASYLDTRAWVLYKCKKYNLAIQYIKEAIHYGGDSSIYYDHYGDILYQLNRVSEAVEKWKKAKEIDPKTKNIDKKIIEKRIYE